MFMLKRLLKAFWDILLQKQVYFVVYFYVKNEEDVKNYLGYTNFS